MFNKIFYAQSGKISAIGSLILKFGTAGFAFLNSILLARQLGVVDYGIYVLAFSIATMLSIPTSLGLPMMISRNVSKYVVRGENAKIKGLILRTNQIVFLLFLFILGIAVILYFLWWKNYNSELVQCIWISFIILFFLSFGSLRNGVLNGMKFVLLGEIPDTFLRNFLLTVFLGLVIFSKNEISPSLAMAMNAIASFIAFLFGHFFLYKKVLTPLKEDSMEFETRTWIIEAIPFTLNAGINIIRQKLSTFILAGFGSLTAVAIFDVALKGASLVSFTLDAINKGIAPFISSAFEKNQRIKLQSIVTKASRLVFIFSIPVALTFMLGGEFIISKLFGKEYYDAYNPLMILCVGQLINAFTGSVGLLLMMTGNQNYLAKVNFLVTIIGTIVMIPLIIGFDVIGASLATCLMLVTQNFIFYNYTKKRLKIDTLIIKV